MNIGNGKIQTPERALQLLKLCEKLPVEKHPEGTWISPWLHLTFSLTKSDDLRSEVLRLCFEEDTALGMKTTALFAQEFGDEA